MKHCPVKQLNTLVKDDYISEQNRKVHIFSALLTVAFKTMFHKG